MTEARPWVPRTLSALVGITGVLLVIQYLLGIWTNAYAPGMFSSGNHSFAPLGFHVVVGYLLGVVALVLLIVAALSKVPRYVAQSFVILVAVALAGLFGMLFVDSTPNNPAYSFAMGFMFLVAFGTCMSLAYAIWTRTPLFRWGSGTSSPPGPTT